MPPDPTGHIGMAFVLNPDGTQEDALEEYTNMEWNEISKTNNLIVEAIEEMKLAIEKNSEMTSEKSFQDLEDKLNIATVRYFKLQLELEESDRELKTLENELKKNPPPMSVMEEWRSLKQDYIFNYSKIVEKKFEEVQRAKWKSLEAKEIEELEIECKRLEDEISKASAMKEEKRDLEELSNSDFVVLSSDQDSEESDIEVIGEIVTSEDKKRWHDSLVRRIKKIEKEKTVFHTRVDQVIRLENKLKTLKSGSSSISDQTPSFVDCRRSSKDVVELSDSD